MSPDLRLVPGSASDPMSVVEALGDPPTAGPLDAFTRIRVGQLIGAYLAPSPVMDAHLDLIDTRGAWYAERAVSVWDPDRPDEFFGLVRHVVRTQLPGPRPDPDVETWLAAGRPAETWLATAWDQINDARYGTSDQRPRRARQAAPDKAVARVDAILHRWDPGHLHRFAAAYGTVERVLDLGIVTLPPVHR